MNEENKETKQTTIPRKGPHPGLIIAVVGLVLLIGYFWRRDDQAVDTGELDKLLEQGDAQDLLQKEVEGLGQALGIGERAKGVEASGTKIVTEDQVAGLGQLLEGDDVDQVVGALESAGIRSVLVDPAIATRNPLPTNNVRNRLALGRPAGRLTAVMMSKELFVYRLGPPPFDLPDEAKKLLTWAARETFADRDPQLPDDAPSLVTAKGNWTMILTVRPVQSIHLSYHSLGDDSLFDAAKRAGKKARAYYERKDFARKYGPLPQALQRIAVELEVCYDWGTFVGPRDDIFIWRIIEPGIHGIMISVDGKNHYLPPWYSVANNYRSVKAMLERVTGRLARKDDNYWRNPLVPIRRFRTVHWRERTPGGEIEGLYRGTPRVPTMKEITRENLIKALRGLGDWIADNQTDPSGKYVYRYFPNKDKENDEYNMVRHALGPFSMALTHEFSPDPKFKLKAEAGMRFMEKRIRWGGPPRKADGTVDKSLDSWMGKPLPGPDVAILEHRDVEYGGGDTLKGSWAAKMGTVAVAILGYTQYRRVGWELGPEREKVLQGLANFLLYMQDPEDGSFHHYYAAPDNGYYGTRNSIYPGEILYAVARLYGETKDERYRAAFQRSLKTNLAWFKEQMAQRLPDGTYEETHRKNLVQFQPWMAMALDEMYRYHQDPLYVEASNLVSLWILETFQFDETNAFFPDYVGGYMKVLDELPAMHSFVYTEGTAASFDLARRAGVDPEILDKLRKGAMLTARFLIQQQTRPGENDFYYPNPQKARGAVRYCMNHNKQRIDYTYHALSAVYRIIRAATAEDYEAAQSIFPSPEVVMDRQTFIELGHELVDWIADYLDEIEGYPVLARHCGVRNGREMSGMG